MRTRTLYLALVMAVAAPSSSGFAQEETHAKKQPKLVFAQGEAKQTVAVDGVRLFFKFPTEKGSFVEAGKDGQAVIDAIRGRLTNLGGAVLSTTHGWDLLKQAKISFSTKGRRIDHDLVVELTQVPSGQLHALVAKVIDESLQASDKLELERIEVFLTDVKEAEVRLALLAEASKDAKARAEQAVSATGVELSGPYYLWTTSETGSPMEQDSGSGFYKSKRMALAAEFVSVQKSFKVSADVPDQLELKVSISGAFEIP